ncbi:MAG: hypothetical protein IPL65_17020 [Lewinellaceae bacterium]|nr:hypothetical protein [Lewinellaceae bacterium]
MRRATGVIDHTAAVMNESQPTTTTSSPMELISGLVGTWLSSCSSCDPDSLNGSG